MVSQSDREVPVRKTLENRVSDISYSEQELTPAVLATLIDLSENWEAENSCHGYRRNTKEDIEGNRIFLACDGDSTVGYLFGHVEQSKTTSSVIPSDTCFFEIEELYITPDYRGRGIGRKLFKFAEDKIAEDVDYIMLSTATKNWKAILHFYIDELDMDFWNARLYKKIKKDL